MVGAAVGDGEPIRSRRVPAGRWMTGFIPQGYTRLVELREAIGRDFLGASLAAGRRQAFLLNAWGELKPIAPELWRGQYGEELLERGHDMRLHGIHKGKNGDLILVRDMPAAAPPVPAKGKGGRTAKWDWEGALVEIAKLERTDGIENKSQADLVRHLGNWFSIHSPDGTAPADSEIRARVKRYQDSLPET